MTDHGSKFSMLLDSYSSDKQRVEQKTSAGTAVFENGLAVLPDDMRGKDVAQELMASDPHRYNYHPGREGGTLKRDHQVMFRMPSWRNQCRVDGCPNEAEIQGKCATHWRERWQAG